MNVVSRCLCCILSHVLLGRCQGRGTSHLQFCSVLRNLQTDVQCLYSLALPPAVYGVRIVLFVQNGLGILNLHRFFFFCSFWDRGLLQYPGWPLVPGLKQSSCLSLLSSWDSIGACRHALSIAVCLSVSLSIDQSVNHSAGNGTHGLAILGELYHSYIPSPQTHLAVLAGAGLLVLCLQKGQLVSHLDQSGRQEVNLP
jgi:hypothetical protein